MPAAPTEIRWTSYAKALVATFFWGLSFIAVRVALESAAPFGVVWMRNALAAALLFALLRWRGKELLPAREDRPRCVLLGLIMGLHLLVQTFAMRFTTAMRAGWIVAFMPAVIALGAWLFQGQRMRASGWLGIAVASAGVLVLTATKPAQFSNAGTGDLLMLSTTLSWAAYALLSAPPTRRNGGLRVAATALAVSVVPSLAAASIGGTWHADATARSIGALVFLGVCASAVAMWTFTDAIAELGPERSSAFQYLQPFFTLAGSFAVLGEPSTGGQWIGGPIVLAGVYLVQRGKRVQ